VGYIIVGGGTNCPLCTVVSFVQPFLLPKYHPKTSPVKLLIFLILVRLFAFFITNLSLTAAYHFKSLTFQAKNSIIVPLLAKKAHTKALILVSQFVTYAAVEKGI